jgi:hypothetical protein
MQTRSYSAALRWANNCKMDGLHAYLPGSSASAAVFHKLLVLLLLAGNRAFAAAGIKLSALADTSASSSAARAALIDRIRYHVVPGLHPIPGGFEAGMLQATLLFGRELKVIYQQ